MSVVKLPQGRSGRVTALIEVEYVAGLARECWEDIWPEWRRAGGHPTPDAGPISHDSCIPTSFALRTMLERCFHDWNWHVVGGRPTKRTPRGGYWTEAWGAMPHLWVEGRMRQMPGRGMVGNIPERRMTVDITADQFGTASDVIVAMGVPADYQANATRMLLKRYFEIERVNIELWVAALSYALQAMD